MITTDVVIIGGGPAGLMLAIELGCRGVDCVVLEEDPEGPDFPKANATSSRTMEHYRRRGFSAEVRALGLVADHPQDVVYCTRLAGIELSRFSIPSRQQTIDRSAFGDYGEESWPTPELPHRVQQMLIEPVLRKQAQSYPSVKLMCGWRGRSMAMDADGVDVAAYPTTIPDTEQSDIKIRARYAIGCDGPRSLVRKTLGIRYEGQSEEQREFFGGQMLSVFFRSSDLYQVLNKKKAWQYWAINRERRCLLIAIDGVDKFLFALQLAPGQAVDEVDYRAAMVAAIGAPFAVDLIGVAPWQAGHTLVADRFKSDRAFIAGDAAHLFTPTGGMGYNTSVDDAVNLGWKLAAVIQGWGGDALLESYEAERKPIAHRNTNFARSQADSVGLIKISPEVEASSQAGIEARAALGKALSKHVASEFNIPGLQLGLSYSDSPVVAREAIGSLIDDPNVYVPTARPGARAPHVWIKAGDGDERSLFDALGRDFTLLYFDRAHSGHSDTWSAMAKKIDIPLQAVFCDSAQARTLYQAEFILIRPDHHVAWRGKASAAPQAILARAVGK
jgi:2-polyprenyl-6-methoxyphenol hydroxylase-like FAD-dependent oxidoreductase